MNELYEAMQGAHTSVKPNTPQPSNKRHLVRLAGADSDTTSTRSRSKSFHEKRRPLKEQAQWLLDVLKSHEPFVTFDPVLITKLTEEMQRGSAGIGEELTTQGVKIGSCFVIASGSLDVVVDGATTRSIDRGDVIGATALVYDVTASETIVAKTEVAFWRLRRSDFQLTVRSDAIARRDEVFRFLKSTSTFAEFDTKLLSRLADVVEVETFAADTVIIAEGESANAMYIITKGKAVVSQEMPQNVDNAQASGYVNKLCGILKEGQYFGERALLTNEPRSATVTAISTVECLRIDSAVFLQLLGPLRQCLNARMPRDSSPAFLQGRTPSRLRSANDSERPTQPGSAPGSVRSSRSWASSSTAEPHCAPSVPASLREAALLKKHGSKRSSASALGHGCDRGEFECAATLRHDGVRCGGASACDLSQHRPSPANASSGDSSPGNCSPVNGSPAASPINARAPMPPPFDALRPEARSLSTSRSNVFRSLSAVKPPGAQSQPHSAKTSLNNSVILSGPNQLLSNPSSGGAPASAAPTPCGPLTAAAAAATAISKPSARAVYRPSVSSLEVRQLLGAGGFARVALARDCESRIFYALKIVSKRSLLATKPELHAECLLREKACLEEMCHPFIVKLFGTYADPENLYFLCELALGGELFRVLGRLEKLPQPAARFYIGSLTLALAHLHALEYVYRDLKPENVLLDNFGFIKLCDFGFAKKVVDRTYTQCGTPDYVSPEMLRGQGVNQAADWWALGVLLYEMLVGFPPFTDAKGSDLKTFSNILRGELRFSEADRQESWARLVKSLCSVRIASRLGYLKGGAEDVISHSWFRNYSWESLVNRTLEPPWQPRLESAHDVRYFEVEDNARDMIPDADVSEELLAQYQPVFDAFVL